MRLASWPNAAPVSTGMFTPWRKAWPFSMEHQASLRSAVPTRRTFTSLPSEARPASKRSPSSYWKLARRLRTMSSSPLFSFSFTTRFR